MTDPLATLLTSLNTQEPHQLWATLRPKLTSTRDGFPAQALGMAMLAQDRLADFWLADFEAIVAERSLIEGDDYVLHMHLIVLLAARRDRRLLAPLLAFCRIDEERSDQWLGDFATSVVARALAAVITDEDTQTLLDFADDTRISVWLRGAAINALSVRAFEGDAEREQTAQTVLAWGEREAARLRDGRAQDSEILGLVISDLCGLGYVEAEPVIKRWFADDLVDPFLYKNMAQVREDMRGDFAASTARMREAGLLYIRDACAEMRDWAMFSKAREDDSRHAFSEDELLLDQPYLRASPKVGRNDPCPCGSGKKFKKCCAA